jgi:hypothetical protein
VKKNYSSEKLAIEALVPSGEFFLCEEAHCKLTKRACAIRHSASLNQGSYLKDRNPWTMRFCAKCETGKRNLEELEG